MIKHAWGEDGMYPALSGDWVRVEEAQAEIDALKHQKTDLLGAQQGTPCKHKFDASVGGVVSCTHCYASFSEQQIAIAKARGDL